MLSCDAPEAKPLFDKLQKDDLNKSPEVKKDARLQFMKNMQVDDTVDPVKVLNNEMVNTCFDNLVRLTNRLDTEHTPTLLVRVKDAREDLVYYIGRAVRNLTVWPDAKKAKVEPAGDGGAAHDSSDDDDGCAMLPDPPLRVVDISNEPDNEPDHVVIDLTNEADN